MNNKMTAEDKRKHLELIQGIINRLSSNTFLFKGWSITIVCAIFAGLISTDNKAYLWLLLGSIIIFWIIDSYYLMLERAYRKLYDRVITKPAKHIDYSMDIKQEINLKNWKNAFVRPVLLLFYGTMLVIVLAFIVYFFLSINITINIKG